MESIFSRSLAGSGEGKKKVVGSGVFSLDPLKCFILKMRKN